jgi:hypothetical protein
MKREAEVAVRAVASPDMLQVAISRDREGQEAGRGGNETASQVPSQTRQTPLGLVVRLSGSGMEVPLVASPSEWRHIVGDPRSLRSIRTDCETGRLPTLPRAGGSGCHHRIAVAKALDELGVPYEIVQGSG